MKKRLLAAALCVTMAMGISGCASDGETASAKNENGGSVWGVAAELEYDFYSNLIGYIEADKAMSVGYKGEIHYYNSNATDWPSSENHSMCRFGVEVLDGNIVYTCGNGGQITKSTDGGVTFLSMPDDADPTPSNARVLSFADKSNGVVAASGAIAKTTDGALTWTKLEGAPEHIATIRMISADKLLCIGSDFNFYKTTDGGATWESAPLNLPLGKGYNNDIRAFVVTEDGENSYTLFCVERESNLVKSFSTTDGWATCTENTIPEIVMPGGALYLNRKGDIMTVTNSVNLKATAIKKQ